MSEYEAEFFQLFRDETNQRLDNMVDVLLALESGRAGGDALDLLFRDVHSIKGGAGMLGLDDVRTLAHAVEDLLETVRAAGAFPPPLADPLLRAADALRRHVAGEGEGTPDLLEELAASRAGVVAPNGGPAERPAAPSTTGGTDRVRGIRVPAEKIDRLLDLVGETVLHRRRLEHVLGEETGDETVADELDVGGRLFEELKDAAIQMRTLPLATITGALPRAVRDVAAETGKHVELVVTGEDTELDRVILESLSDPLIHILRNAVGHGIESPEERRRAGKPERATVSLSAIQRGGHVEITIADDGRGVRHDLLVEAQREGSLVAVLARAGFSTAERVTDLSGRGVGLDAVKAHVESFGGTLEAKSEAGKGTEFRLTLPLALALMEVLLVERGGQPYGVPLANVDEAISVEDTLSLGGHRALELRGRSLPLADLAELVGATGTELEVHAPAIVVSGGGRRVAAVCDRLLGEEEVVVKPLGPLLPTVRGYLGAAILGDGRIALLLDPAALTGAPRSRQSESAAAAGGDRSRLAPKVLVVEDSYTVRELQRSILEAAGYRVDTARDGSQALTQVLADPDISLVLTDIEMPELDGIELTRAIRANAARASLPVVVVTSRGSEDDQLAGIEAGADAYMVKQAFDQQALLETVERLVGR